jgi:threonine/homoserine efflux transporter RhtA
MGPRPPYTGEVRTARNVAIVMLLALGVAFLPGGGNVAEAVITGLTMALLAGIAWMIYVLSRENQLTLATLSDGRRAILYGAVGMVALLIAGSDKLFASGGGTLLWIVLLAASIAAIWKVWMEANTYH